MKKKLSISNLESASIDTSKVMGGIGGPALSIGTNTGHIPPSGDPKDVTKGDWLDEGCKISVGGLDVSVDVAVLIPQ